MKRLKYLALAALVAVAACGDDGTPAIEPDIEGNVTGVVTVDGAPLAGVTVRLDGATSQTATTGADGSFSFASVPAGTYGVSLENVPSDVSFSVGAKITTIATQGQTASVNFSGSYIRTAAITGTISATTEDGTATVAGVAVSLSGVESKTATSDADGLYSFTGLRAGAYTVTIDPGALGIEFGTTSQDVTLATGGVAKVDFAGVMPSEPRVYIQKVHLGGGFDIPPNAIAGWIYVDLAVSPGTEQVTRVGITLDGEEVATQDVSLSVVGPEAGAMAAGASPVTLPLNSAAYDPTTFIVEYVNGDHELGAFLETAEGNTATADISWPLTFANPSVVSVEWVGDGGQLIRGGNRWHGGPQDFTLHAQAINYESQVAIDQIGVMCTSATLTANGPFDLDIGEGNGDEILVEAPFDIVVSHEDNFGDVEDVPAPGGFGHTCAVVSVLDPDGLNIIDQFPIQVDLDDFFVDFTPPEPASPGVADDILIDDFPADDIDEDGVGGELPLQFFSAGDFDLDNMAEFGVGGTNLTWDAWADDDDDDPAFENVSSIDDLSEHGIDAGDADYWYRIEVTNLADDLGNAWDLADDPVAGDPDNLSVPFFVDMSAPETDDVLPEPEVAIILNPDDDNADGDIATAHRLVFSAEDPDLSDEFPGSGLAAFTAEDQDGVVLTVTPLVAPDFEIDPLTADVANAYGLLGRIADDEYEITATLPDLAVRDPNTTEIVWNVTIDSTDPETNMLNPPGSAIESSNSTLTFTISGNASDENGLSEVVIMVLDADAGVVDVCELTDTPLTEGTAAGNVVENDIDVTADAEAGFSRTVTIYNAGVTQDVCFFILAKDNATDNEGNEEPNTSNQSARTVITWH